MADDELPLVRRCLADDPVAVRQLIGRFEADVFGLCYRMLGHRHDAEDVCQEVFLRAFRALHRWDATRPLRPWILGIAANRCRTALGRRKNRPTLAEFLPDVAEAKPADDSAELTAAVHAAVEQLRPDYRAAFVLFHEQGCSYDEIGAALGRPTGTVKTWLHRARAELLDHLRRAGLIEPEPTAEVRRDAEAV